MERKNYAACRTKCSFSLVTVPSFFFFFREVFDAWPTRSHSTPGMREGGNQMTQLALEVLRGGEIVREQGATRLEDSPSTPNTSVQH